jgi:hypothetical protein
LKGEFSVWHDILRNEKPLNCTVSFSGPDFDPSQPVRTLYWMQLNTGMEEPPGEGPEGLKLMRLPLDVKEFLLRDEQAST